MPELLARTLRAFDGAELNYCVLRDADRLADLAGGGEIDVLVDPGHIDALRRCVARLGFAELSRPGHAPHHFFVGYDAAADGWLKLDVVTAIAYGRPSHAWRTPLAGPCLAHRRRTGAAVGPAAEEGLVTLLLHCVLDKAAFPEADRARLRALAAAARDHGRVTDLLDAGGATMWTAAAVAAAVAGEQWAELLGARAAIGTELDRRDPVGTPVRRLRDRFMRKADRLRRMVRPQLPMVALLAPDGAGKSSLADGLARAFPFRVHMAYMGLYQQGARRRAWSRVKGLGLIGHLATQWARYGVARWQQGRDRLVVFDRYPYDAYLPAARREGALRRARRWLLARACPAPDMIVLLDAPGAVLYARKGEHDPAALEAARQRYLALRAFLPRMTVVDATRPAARVRRDVTALIWRHVATRSDDRHRSAACVADAMADGGVMGAP